MDTLQIEHEGDIFTHLSSIKGLADGMTDICNSYNLDKHVVAQLFAYSNGITALADKADKLASEVEAASCDVKPAANNSLRWDYWQDDVCEIDTLIAVAITLNESDDLGGSHVVLEQALSKASFLNSHMDSVNAGKTKSEVYARKEAYARDLKVAS